jgi:twinfilin-like protein
MSSQSGITPSKSLQEDFHNLSKDSSLLFVKLEIQNDTFVKTGSGKKSGSKEGDFSAIKGSLEEKQPAYVLFRAAEEGKWVCLSYIPSSAIVRSKMVYASSKAALKSGLGGDKFVQDYNVTTKDEVSLADWSQSLKGVGHESLMTPEERQYQETRHEHSAGTSEGKVTAIVGVPIKVADSALNALKSIKNGQASSVELIIDPSTETLGSQPANNTPLANFKYPEKEPRFYVHNFAHKHEGSSVSTLLFIYYCPNNAVPKLKMLYSTCKAHILKIFESLSISDFHNLEANEPSELTEDLVIADIHPAAAEDRSFKKVAARGRGQRSKPAKFNPDA